MCAELIPWSAVIACLCYSSLCLAENVLFEDDFDHGLSSKWEAVGLTKEDYRIRDGGLELRVQPGKMTRDTPMLRVFAGAAFVLTVLADRCVVVAAGEPASRLGRGVQTDGAGRFLLESKLAGTWGDVADYFCLHVCTRYPGMTLTVWRGIASRE